MAKLKKSGVWVLIGVLAALSFGAWYVIREPGTFEWRNLRLQRGTIVIPRILVSWNFKDTQTPRLSLNAPRILFPGFDADGLMIIFRSGPDSLYIARLGGEKTAFQDIRAHFSWRFNRLDLENISGIFAGQEVLGAAKWDFYRNDRYRLSLAAGALPAQAVVHAMEWEDKVSIKGLFSARLELEGRDGRLTRLDGTFDSVSGGGTITVLDQELLRKVADSSHQPFEIVKASFENYDYTTGRARLFLEKSDLRLDLALEGEAGKRQLEVNLHDLFPQT